MSFYRNVVWYMKGLKEYTRGGYEAACKEFMAADLDGIDLSGKQYLITGSNSGIGCSMAESLAALGGSVHLVCRNMESANKAKAEIIQKTGNENVFVHHLDLSNTSSIFKFTEKFKNQPGQLDVLINNAGCMVNTRQMTSDGKLELNFATNTLGTYCLTSALLPLISKSAEGRVVTVSSGGMLVSKLDLSDLQSEKVAKFDGTMVYSQNKRQQVVMTEQWAAQYPGIHFSVMHPGWADTPAVRSSMPEFHKKMESKLRTPAQGADTTVWLAASPAALKQPSGKFFQDRKVVSEHLPLACTRASSEDHAELMWQLEELAVHYRDQC